MNITKATIFNSNPRQMVQLHFQHGDPWQPAIKRTNDAAADPESYEKGIQEIKQNAKFEVIMIWDSGISELDDRATRLFEGLAE